MRNSVKVTTRKLIFVHSSFEREEKFYSFWFLIRQNIARSILRTEKRNERAPEEKSNGWNEEKEVGVEQEASPGTNGHSWKVCMIRVSRKMPPLSPFHSSFEGGPPLGLKGRTFRSTQASNGISLPSSLKNPSFRITLSGLLRKSLDN